MNPAHILYDYLQQKNRLNNRFIVAVSGGKDSMCLLHACVESGLDVIAAHCNFKLRGEESDGDEMFVMRYCADKNIPLVKTTFDTKQAASAKKLSTQEAARVLRYEWFEDMRVQYHADYILTAHHGEDSIETFLINLLRGTGIKGLTGIPKENGCIIRPLLSLLRSDIDAYASSSEIPFRNDSSNESDAYTRNYIRHYIIPLLKEVNSKALHHILEASSVLNETELLVNNLLETPTRKYTQQNGDVFSIHIDAIRQLPYKSTLLYRWLNPYGFNEVVINDLLAEHQTGKKWYSPTHQVIYERGYLSITAYAVTNCDELVFGSHLPDTIEFAGLSYSIRTLTDRPETFATDTLYMDGSRITFPVTIRPWKHGDTFIPFGMRQQKKLSDFFIDLKLNAIQKEQAMILESSQGIFAIAPYRISNHVKITRQTSRIIAIAPTQKKQA